MTNEALNGPELESEGDVAGLLEFGLRFSVSASRQQRMRLTHMMVLVGREWGSRSIVAEPERYLLAGLLSHGEELDQGRWPS